MLLSMLSTGWHLLVTHSYSLRGRAAVALEPKIQRTGAQANQRVILTDESWVELRQPIIPSTDPS